MIQVQVLQSRTNVSATSKQFDLIILTNLGL